MASQIEPSPSGVYISLNKSPTKEARPKKANETLSCEQLNLTNLDNTIDPKCILEIKQRFVRIEYPGEVRDVDKAIQTLGGIENIEMAVGERGQLNLHFHSKNKLNKPCVADKDFKSGILIKVKKNQLNESKYDYEVVGVSAMNFTFNRLCDFQYLPLTAEQPETKQSQVENLHEKIFPKDIPNAEWLNCNESKNMEPFLPPSSFALYDNAHLKFNVDNPVKSETVSKPSTIVQTPKQKNLCRIFGKTRRQLSIFVKHTDKTIPEKPLDIALKLVETRFHTEIYNRVKQLFETRPIWTKNAIIYNTGMTAEQAKVVLPSVAYFFLTGPWKRTWVRFGYNPWQDPDSRIYQTLDYRIKGGESAFWKISAARCQATKQSMLSASTFVRKVSLKEDISTKQRTDLDERCYVLRPHTIPTARQMFYTLCDIILPEIQDMILMFPKVPTVQCNIKTGWFQQSFLEKCRKIVNDYVLEAIQKTLQDDKKVQQEKTSKEKTAMTLKKETQSTVDYCNEMLSNIKKGIYKNAPPVFPSTSKLSNESFSSDTIDLSSDDEDDRYTMNEIIQTNLPENMEDDQDEQFDEELEEENHSSDEGDIDLEVAEEIKQMLSEK